MATLTIIGGIGQLKILAKAEAGRARRYGLKMSIEQDKQGDQKPPVKSESPKRTRRTKAEIEEDKQKEING